MHKSFKIFITPLFALRPPAFCPFYSVIHGTFLQLHPSHFSVDNKAIKILFNTEFLKVGVIFLGQHDIPSVVS